MSDDFYGRFRYLFSCIANCIQLMSILGEWALAMRYPMGKIEKVTRKMGISCISSGYNQQYDINNGMERGTLLFSQKQILELCV